MKIIAVSGDGAGAGKTWAATVFGGAVWTIADSIRTELQTEYPHYNWFDRTQRGKTIVVREYGDGTKSIRQVMTEYGQEKCAEDPQYWIKKLVDRLNHEDGLFKLGSIAIDDVRKCCELNYLRENFKDVVHLHVCNPEATPEPIFDAEELKKAADYRISWT